MRILVTGASGYVGSLLVARLHAAGQEVVAFGRDRSRVEAALGAAAAPPGLPVVVGDALAGSGLDAALDGAELAYYLIHSMEPSTDGSFPERERRSAESFAAAARRAGTRRIVYLGGLLPAGAASAHLGSRHAVEQILLDAVPDSVALRASIVIGARSRSFRFLVRLVERLPVLALPAWRVYRTAPIDERDILEYLMRAAGSESVGGRSLDVAGPDVLTYEQMIGAIADAMLVARPSLRLGFSLTGLAAPIAAAIAGEQVDLVGPLMEGLTADLLPRDREVRTLMPIRLHRFSAAVEHALADWERVEPLRAR